MDLDLIFKNNWRTLLAPYIESQEFTDHMNWLANEYNTKKVYPHQTLIFKAFNMCAPENLRVVWIGLDPYPGGQATGIAMGVKFAARYPPTLQIIEREHNRDLDKDGLDLSFMKYANKILFLNTALTLEAKKTKSHWNEWQPFTRYVLNTINEKCLHTLFILLGSQAQSYGPLITNETHFVLSLPHPMREVYSPGCGFIGSGLFSIINNHVKTYYNEEPIY